MVCVKFSNLIRKNKKERLIFLWLVILLTIPLLVNTEENNKAVSLRDRDKPLSYNNMPNDFKNFGSIVMDQSGTFEDPITINFPAKNASEEFQRATISITLSRGSPLHFSFDANETQFIDVEIDINGEAPDSEIIVDILSGDNYDFIDSFRPEFLGQFPFYFGYPIPMSGPQLIITDLRGAKSQVDMKLIITRFVGGAFGEGVSLVEDIFQSNTHQSVDNIVEYLVNDFGYLSMNPATFDLGDFDEDSDSLAKGISLAIFGLLRAGELVASDHLERDPPEVVHETFLPYLEVSYELLDFFIQNRLHPTGGLFYEGHLSDPSNPDYVFTLETNTYLLMAMLEIWNFYGLQHNEYGTEDFQRANSLIQQINQTALDMETVFYDNGNGIFMEISQINSNVSLAGSTTGDQVYLESNALLGEVLLGIAGANMDASGSITQQIANLVNRVQGNITKYIDSNLINMQMDLSSLLPSGIGYEYYDEGTNKPSNTSTLLGQAFLISLFTPTGPRAFSNITFVTEIATNTLKLFLNQDNGLLYDSILTNETGTSGTTSIINSVVFLTAIDRLSESWKSQEFNRDSALDISRTWSKAVRDLHNDMNNILFDEQTNSYFAQYDHVSHLLIRDDKYLEKNNFIANTAILDLLSKTFPIKVVINAPKEMIVDVDASMFINIQQINSLRKSWLWFQPERNFAIQAKISIPKHNFEETEEIDLGTFDFESGFLDIFFSPITRGNFEAIIELSVEGTTLLEGRMSLVAFGIVFVEFDHEEFQTTSDDIDFSGTISVFDEQGRAVSNLEVEAIIGPLENFGDEAYTYLVEARTDSSGKATLEFDITDLELDFPLIVLENISIFELPILVNITNAASLKYHREISRIPFQVEKNFLHIQTTPSESIQITGQTLFQQIEFDQKLSTITLEVSVEDSFGKAITADSVSIDWVDDSGTDVDIYSEASSSPATFSIDPTDLDVGEYEIIIEVEKEGFTRGDEPVVIIKTLIVEAPSIWESAAAAVLIFGGFIAGKIIGMIFGIFLSRTKVNISCPNCGQDTKSSQKACSSCGNVLPGKKLSIIEKISAKAKKITKIEKEKIDKSIDIDERELFDDISQKEGKSDEKREGEKGFDDFRTLKDEDSDNKY